MFYDAFFFSSQYLLINIPDRKRFDFMAYPTDTEMKFVQGEAWCMKSKVVGGVSN